MQLSCAKIFRSCHMKVRKLMHQIGLLYHLYYLEEGTFCPFRTFSGGRHFLLPFRTHWSKTVIDKERMVKNVTKLPWSKSITAVGHKMTFQIHNSRVYKCSELAAVKELVIAHNPGIEGVPQLALRAYLPLHNTDDNIFFFISPSLIFRFLFFVFEGFTNSIKLCILIPQNFALCFLSSIEST